MTTTPTVPLDDRRMWRRAIAALHPDRGGDHEACVWIQAVREHVCGGHATDGARTGRQEAERRHGSSSSGEADRVPYPPSTDFAEATRRALARAEIGDDYGLLLATLRSCFSKAEMRHEQERGASYRRLAAIGHMSGFDARRRGEWYEVARSIPLSDRHAGHILGALKRRSA